MLWPVENLNPQLVQAQHFLLHHEMNVSFDKWSDKQKAMEDKGAWCLQAAMASGRLPAAPTLPQGSALREIIASVRTQPLPSLHAGSTSQQRLA